MIILPDYKMVVLGPPKCASTTLHKELVKPPWYGFSLYEDNQHHFGIPEAYQRFRIVTPARDPYERTMSLYWHYLRDVRRVRAQEKGMMHAREWQTIQLPFKEITLVRYMEMILDNTVLYLESYMYQFYLHTISDWLSLVPRVDSVIHVESLNEDWSALFDHRVDVKFAYHNNPGRDTWDAHKSARAIELIEAWAGDDFTRFGYDRQTCPH